MWNSNFSAFFLLSSLFILDVHCGKKSCSGDEWRCGEECKPNDKRGWFKSCGSKCIGRAEICWEVGCIEVRGYIDTGEANMVCGVERECYNAYAAEDKPDWRCGDLCYGHKEKLGWMHCQGLCQKISIENGAGCRVNSSNRIRQEGGTEVITVRTGRIDRTNDDAEQIIRKITTDNPHQQFGKTMEGNDLDTGTIIAVIVVPIILIIVAIILLTLCKMGKLGQKTTIGKSLSDSGDTDVENIANGVGKTVENGCDMNNILDFNDASNKKSNEDNVEDKVISFTVKDETSDKGAKDKNDNQ